MALHARRASGLLLVIFGLFLSAGPISAARAAEFGIADFSVRMLDAAGNPEVRAGSHPDRLQIDFALETEGTGTSVKDLATELPPGFGGDPAAVPACPRQAHEEGEECPSDTQVGTVSFGSAGEPLPIYRLEPEAGKVADFTSKAGLPIPIQMKLRPDDFGITLEGNDIVEGGPSKGRIELWGVPADHQAAPTAPSSPFLTAPTTCGLLVFTLRTRSHEEGAPWLSASSEAGPLTGCESLRFAPRLSLQLGNPIADSPTGVRMVLSMPEEEGGELASAQMKDAVVALPPGLTVSPGGAAGLALCTDAQLGLGSEAAATCPAAARVGTVELTSASLSEPLTGAVYLGERRGSQRFRMFIVAPGPGIVLKFVTSLQPDLASGGLVANLHDLPQVGIAEIALSLNGGPDGLLATPLGCGPARGEARLVPYGDGPAVTSTAAVTIASALPGLACPGPLPFAPQLLVYASSHRAGQATAFSATLHRRGGEGMPTRFAMTLPAGLSAALGSFEACPEPLAGSGNCPAESRVGSIRAEAGSGSRPAVLTGAAYIAGPYRRAPFSLIMALRATVGPFDLGSLAFRAAVQIDAHSGRVAVVTDRLPSVVEGVPIRFQTIALALDRRGLVHNPTSCRPHSLDATLESQEGGTAALSGPYPVSGCKRLGFAPRMRVALTSHGRLRKDKPVGMRVSSRFRPADTALRSLVLSMPPALKFNVAGLKEICSRPDARRSLCPPGSKVGTARARTPLLDQPLTGSVHVVQPRDHGEPDLWVALAGGGLELAVHGTTASEDGRFVTRLAGLPDLPLSDFTMRLGAAGGDLLSLGVNPCANGRARRLDAQLRASGQNGARRSTSLPIVSGSSCLPAAPR